MLQTHSLITQLETVPLQIFPSQVLLQTISQHLITKTSVLTYQLLNHLNSYPSTHSSYINNSKSQQQPLRLLVLLEHTLNHLCHQLLHKLHLYSLPSLTPKTTANATMAAKIQTKFCQVLCLSTHTKAINTHHHPWLISKKMCLYLKSWQA